MKPLTTTFRSCDINTLSSQVSFESKADICRITLVCVDQTGRKKKGRRKLQLDDCKLDEEWWKDGEKGETEGERNGPDMGISMSSNGRMMTLFHLPLNPIRAPSSAVAGSVIPPSVPGGEKKHVIKCSLVRKMQWVWLGFFSHYSLWQTMLLVGVVVSFIPPFDVKMGVKSFHLSGSFHLLLWDVLRKLYVIWVLSCSKSSFFQPGCHSFITPPAKTKRGPSGCKCLGFFFCFFTWLHGWQNHAGRALYFWSNNNLLISRRCPLNSQRLLCAAQLSTHLLAQARRGCYLTFFFPFFLAMCSAVFLVLLWHKIVCLLPAWARWSRVGGIWMISYAATVPFCFFTGAFPLSS